MPAPAYIAVQFRPHPALRPYVQGYGYFVPAGRERDSRLRETGETACWDVFYSGDPFIELMPPCGQMSLLFNLGDPFALETESRKAALRERSHVLGAFSRWGRMELGCRVEFLGVLFQPGQARAFLSPPADSLTDRFTPLDDVWGTAGRQLEAELHETSTVARKVQRLERELLRRLTAEWLPDARFQSLIEFILHRRGAVSVEELSHAAGTSRQHLTRKFQQFVGLSPKFFSRVVRFYAASALAHSQPSVNWAALALDLGYYDQAHLIAEFKEFTGLTPGQLVRPPRRASALAAD